MPLERSTGRLDGKVALITGAARGQGRSHALALARLGAAIVAVDVPGPIGSVGYPLGTKDDLDRTTEEVEAEGVRCIGIGADVRDGAAVEAAVARAVGELGRLDVLVANAGIVTLAPLDQVTDEAWRDMLDVNLTGVFHCLRAAIKPMRAGGFGRIVVTSSMGGRMGIAEQGAYNATKWGVIGLAKSLALEVAREGITVNVVCPCTVDTPMVRPGGAMPEPDVLQRFRRVNPIPEPWIEAEDVTRAVVYLVTDPGVITGSVLEIGLGSSARQH